MSKRNTINTTTDAEARPERVDAEKVDTETTDAEKVDTETTDAEKVDTETTDAEKVDSEAAAGESDAADGDTDADDTPEDVEPDELNDPGKLLAALRRARSEAKNLRTRAKTAERVAAQYTAAAEVGLALTWASRLQGNTPEELKADAAEFIKAVGTVAAPPRLQALPDDGVARGGSNEPAEERDLTVIGSRMYSN